MSIEFDLKEIGSVVASQLGLTVESLSFEPFKGGNSALWMFKTPEGKFIYAAHAVDLPLDFCKLSERLSDSLKRYMKNA
jgi:hypothetical protein